MRNGKYSKRGVASKTLVLVLALVLTLGCVVGGTIAWLTDKTAAVTNTFTVGDVAITLKESELKDDGTYADPAEGVTNTYKMIPGTEYKKDPTVAVVKGSEACYLFVKFEEVNTPSTYITYTSKLTEAEGWKLVEGQTNVWYREVSATDAATGKSWDLLDGDKITIKDSVTKENIQTAATAKLVYTAYAIQKDNTGTAAEAWAKLQAAQA